MASLNKVFLIGNLTRDPEVRYTPSGAAVCEFGLAVNRKYTANNQEHNETCFVEIVVWGKQAESCGRYLEKGAPALIEGRLKFDQWQDKNSGAKRSKLQVVAERVQFLSRGERRSPDGGNGQWNNGGNDYPQGNQGGYPGNQGGYNPGGQGNSYGDPSSYTPPPPPAPTPAPAMPDQGNVGFPNEPQGAFNGGSGAEDDIPF